MANLSFSSITQSSFMVRLVNLDTAYDNGSRTATFVLSRNGTTISTKTISIPDRASASSYVTFSGLLSKTMYMVDCTVYYVGGNTGFIDFVTTLDPDPVIPNPSYISFSNVSMSGFRASWPAVDNYEQGYDIYLNGSYYSHTYNTYYDFYGMSPDTTYQVGVGSVGGSGYTVGSVRTSGYPPSTPTGLHVNSKTTTSIWFWWTNPGNTVGFDLEFKRVGGVVETYYTSLNYYNFTGLLPNTSYQLRIRAYNQSGESAWTSWVTGTTDSGRPDNWSWEYNIASGALFYSQSGKVVYLMRAAHWNAFTTRINDFRKYKLGEGQTYTFTTASTSTTSEQVTVLINQAIDAINAMLPIGKMANISKGTIVAASIFTNMRDKLNSIS